jgi:outer membrane receptor protein involved in Fe transport
VGLGHDVGENGHLSFRDSFFFDSRGMPGLDSGSVGEAGQRAKAHQRRLRNLSALRYEAVDLGRYGLDATVELAYLFERVRFRDVDETPPIATDDRNGALTHRVRLDAEREVAFSSHRASSVFEYRHDTLVSDEFADQRRNSLGVVVQDDIGFFSRRVRVLPALRFDDTEGFETEWLPRIGLIVEPAEGVRFKANLEMAYRVPNFDELFLPDKGFIRGNAALEPEKSTDGDVGIELDFGRLGPLRDLFFQAAWFHRDIDESIVFVLVNQSLVEPHNTGSATIKGVELAASLGITGWIELSANYTHLDATRDDPDVPLPGRPRNETNLRIEVGPPSRAAKLVLQMQDTDEIPVTDTGGTVLPARTVWDASIVLDLARLFPDRSPLGDLTLSVEGKNLTDEIVRDAQFFPQPGRSFAVRLEAEW